MKLFDYKLILLITLTFVIYFMYREIQNLNQRIDKVEKNIEELPKKQIHQQQEPQFINFTPPQNNMIIQEEQNVVNLSPNITKNTIHNLETNTNNNLNDILPNDSCTISTELEEDSEELQQMNQNNMLEAEDAVEIYSNDNIEEVSSQKTSEIDEDDIVIKEPVNISQNIINQVINDINDEDTFSASSVSIEELNLEENESPELVDDEIEVNSPRNNLEELKTEQQRISDDNDDDEIKLKVNVDDLVKQKKLNELKEMAKKMNIELRYNGKAKTKKQLAVEICNLQNNQ